MPLTSARLPPQTGEGAGAGRIKTLPNDPDPPLTPAMERETPLAQGIHVTPGRWSSNKASAQIQGLTGATFLAVPCLSSSSPWFRCLVLPLPTSLLSGAAPMGGSELVYVIMEQMNTLGRRSP